MKSKKNYIGKFSFGKYSNLPGTLTVDGRNSRLDLNNESFFYYDCTKYPTIFGLLEDYRKVTLVNCVSLSSTGSRSVKIDGKWHGHSTASAFPHYAVFGDKNINPDAETIKKIRIIIKGENAAFYQPFLFSSAFDADDLAIKAIKRTSKKMEHEIKIGSHPQIWFYAGQTKNMLGRTDVGEITLLDCYRSQESSRGISVKNRPSIQIEFFKPLSFHAILPQALEFMKLLGILGGEALTLKKLELVIAARDPSQSQQNFDVYFSLPPGGKDTPGRTVLPIDVPVRYHDSADEFQKIVTNWFATNSERRNARSNAIHCVLNFGRYSPQRLMTAASAFDLLPASSKPCGAQGSHEFQNLIEETKVKFRGLEKSPERESILDALGRFNKPNLRKIIEHRAAIVCKLIPDHLPEIEIVIRQAVLARNFYVHGTQGDFDYESNPALCSFLMDTLEFILIAAELIEAGWNIKRWMNEGGSGTYPFSRYLLGYHHNLQALKAITSRE